MENRNENERCSPDIEQQFDKDCDLLVYLNSKAIQPDGRVKLDISFDELKSLRAALTARSSAATVTVPVDAIVNLVNHQQQCDMDGVMVQVSRQALCEVLAYVTEVRPDNKWADDLAQPSQEQK